VIPDDESGEKLCKHRNFIVSRVEMDWIVSEKILYTYHKEPDDDDDDGHSDGDGDDNDNDDDDDDSCN